EGGIGSEISRHESMAVLHQIDDPRNLRIVGSAIGVPEVAGIENRVKEFLRMGNHQLARGKLTPQPNLFNAMSDNRQPLNFGLLDQSIEAFDGEVVVDLYEIMTVGLCQTNRPTSLVWSCHHEAAVP